LPEVRILAGATLMASMNATLEITSDLRELPRMRAFLEQTCRQHYGRAVSADELGQVLLAATEALSNIVLHAYQRQPGHPIRIEAEMASDGLAVRLYHRGQAYEGDPGPPPPLEEPREDHMGLYIIHQCVDALAYSRTDAGENCVQLVKIWKDLQAPA
jgi:anti-sigma regulatory factor (Ser/Thr protein kinase)